MLPVVRAEEALSQRLGELATAAGLPVPALEEDDKEGTLPRVRGDAGEARIIVPPELFEAAPAAQIWHLATCLGWWHSRTPWRRRLGARTCVALVIAIWSGVALFRGVWLTDPPGHVLWSAHAVLGAILPFFVAAAGRYEQRSFDAAGLEVLRAAGHDPVDLTRQVFGDEPDPPWFRRLLMGEPAPSTRVAAAERLLPEPHPPLF